MSPQRLRLPGLDAARALALLGMVMVHVGPNYGDDWAGWLYALPHGRAAIGFVVLAGISVSLMAAGRDAGGRSATVVRLLWRACVLLPLGLWLQTLNITALVILPTYAALFVLAVGGLWLGRRALLAVVLLLAASGPVAGLALQVHTPMAFGYGSLEWGDPVPEILLGLAVSGPYPLLSWAAPFAFGLWLGRLQLERLATQWFLCIGGALVSATAIGTAYGLRVALGTPEYLVGWNNLLTMEPHSQMPLWLLSATGIAVAVIGGCLLLARVVGRVIGPLAAVGRLTLSYYVGHLLMLAGWPALGDGETASEALPVVAVLAVFAVVFAVIWLRLVRWGPLETLLEWPGRRAGQFASELAARRGSQSL